MGRLDQGPNRILSSPLMIRAARWGVLAWVAIGLLVLAIIFFRYVIFPVRIIFPPIVLALIFVYLLNPVVTWMTNRGIPRLLATLVTYLVILSAIGVGLRYLIPVLVDQVEHFSKTLPTLLTNAQAGFRDLLDRFGIEGGTGALDSAQILDAAERLFSLTKGLLSGALILMLGLILGFYLLVDLPNIRRGAILFVPARRRPAVLAVLRKVGAAIGGFFRGQLLVAVFVGIASTIVLFIVGLPYWALVGMITGLFNLIPLIGPFIGGGIAAFIAFTTTGQTGGLLHLEPGWPLAIGSAIALTIVQQIDNHIISPNVVARTVKLHPVTVMLALLAGGTLLGLWGMLLAVPVVASAKILMLHAWDTQATWPPTPEGAPVQPQGPSPPQPPPPGAPAPPREAAGLLAGMLGRWRRRKRLERRAAAPGDAEPLEPAEPRP